MLLSTGFKCKNKTLSTTFVLRHVTTTNFYSHCSSCSPPGLRSPTAGRNVPSFAVWTSATAYSIDGSSIRAATEIFVLDLQQDRIHCICLTETDIVCKHTVVKLEHYVTAEVTRRVARQWGHLMCWC